MGKRAKSSINDTVEETNEVENTELESQETEEELLEDENLEEESEVDEEEVEESDESEDEFEEDEDEEEEEVEEVVEKPKAKPKAKTATAPKRKKKATSKRPVSDREKTRIALSKEEKVPVYIPLLNGEKKGNTQQVYVNGYPFMILKGQNVPVPKSVAEIVNRKFAHKQDAGDHENKLEPGKEVKLTTFGA